MNQIISESSTQQSLQITDNSAIEEPLSDDNMQPSSPPPISSRPERTKSVVITITNIWFNFQFVIVLIISLVFSTRGQLKK